MFWKYFIHMQLTQTNASVFLVTCSLPIHPSAIQPGLEHHFFSYMCQQNTTKANDISPEEEQAQTLIILSMLILLSRTNQRGDGKKSPELLVWVSLRKSKLQISCASNQHSDFHEQRYASPW